jgi:hypothetical protein
VHPDDVRRRAGVIVSSTGQLADIIDALVDGR